MHSRLIFILITAYLCCCSLHATTTKTVPPASTNRPSTTSISSNPAAVNVGTGTGTVQRYIEKKLGIKNNHGISTQGAWFGDTNQLFSGR